MIINPEKIIPYYQPIIAADTRKIFSYEVLGRYIDDEGNVKSLGPIFADNLISDEKLIDIDHVVRRKAMEDFANNLSNELLFINLRLDWLVRYHKNPELAPTIVWAKELGIDFSRIVIEITEEEFNSDQHIFTAIIDYYKKLGCKIAIDDYGNRASDIDRLALVGPDIIKFDMLYVHKSEESGYYQEYLRALTSFAERVGIEVLYEGIENSNQLDICIGSKGRFFQGFYLGKPQPAIKNMQINEKGIVKAFDSPIARLRGKSQHMHNVQNTLDEKIKAFFDNKKQLLIADANHFVSALYAHLPNFVERIYICNELGKQVSCNFEKVSGRVYVVDYRNKNWLWRRYFQDAVKAFIAGRKSYVSGGYRDVTTKKKLYTYVFFANYRTFIFLDVSMEPAN